MQYAEVDEALNTGKRLKPARKSEFQVVKVRAKLYEALRRKQREMRSTSKTKTYSSSTRQPTKPLIE